MMAEKKQKELKLTPKQAKFAREYLRTGNACEAMRQAYPQTKKWTQNALKVQACRNLAKPNISLTVKRLQDKANAEAIADYDECCRILTEIARAALTDYTTDGCLDYEKIRRNPRALQEIIEEATVDGGLRRKFKLRDPRAAIETLAKLRGYNAPERTEAAEIKDITIRIVKGEE